MKKFTILGLSIVIFLFTTMLMAEDYISKDFPAVSVILKNLNERGRYLWKSQNANGTYFVYIEGSNNTISYQLIKLDTNVWVFQDPQWPTFTWKTLQK